MVKHFRILILREVKLRKRKEEEESLQHEEEDQEVDNINEIVEEYDICINS